jgi:hypothetical protein
MGKQALMSSCLVPYFVLVAAPTPSYSTRVLCVYNLGIENDPSNERFTEFPVYFAAGARWQAEMVCQHDKSHFYYFAKRVHGRDCNQRCSCRDWS